MAGSIPEGLTQEQKGVALLFLSGVNEQAVPIEQVVTRMPTAIVDFNRRELIDLIDGTRSHFNKDTDFKNPMGLCFDNIEAAIEYLRNNHEGYKLPQRYSNQG